LESVNEDAIRALLLFSQKINNTPSRTGVVAQLAEHLLSTPEDPGSNPLTGNY